VPYWWDSAGFVMQTAHWFYIGHLWPLTSTYTDFAHPTLLSILLAISWKLFGNSLLISHIISLCFTLLAVIYTYFIGKTLFKDKLLGNLVGFCSGLLLLATPVFLAQVGIIYLEIPIAGLAAASYYYYLHRQYGRFAIFATLMVLMKEVTFIIALLFFVLSFVSVVKKRKKLSIKAFRPVLLTFIPIVSITMWFIYHKLITGWYFVLPHRSVRGVSPFDLDLGTFFSSMGMMFFDQWRFLLLVLGVGSLIYGYIRGKKQYKGLIRITIIDLFPLVGIPLVMGLLFAKTEFLYRYSIVFLPFFYIGCTASIAFMLRVINKHSQLLTGVILCCVTGLVVLLFYSQWDTHREITSLHFPPIEEDLEYLNIVHLGQEVSNYLVKNYPNGHIYGSFPFSYMLLQPYQHYVKNPLHFTECSQYKRGDRVDVIIIHPYSPGEEACAILANTLRYRKTQLFKDNGKAVVLIKK
jgi:4-amino-4-deoxy-L-arabinose transferase-like glycosyltransferase